MLRVKVHIGVSRGQPGIKLHRNVLRLPNLEGQTPDQKSNTGVEGHVKVSQGQAGVKLLRNALGLPNLPGRTPDHHVGSD